MLESGGVVTVGGLLSMLGRCWPCSRKMNQRGLICWDALLMACDGPAPVGSASVAEQSSAWSVVRRYAMQ